MHRGLALQEMEKSVRADTDRHNRHIISINSTVMPPADRIGFTQSRPIRLGRQTRPKFAICPARPTYERI